MQFHPWFLLTDSLRVKSLHLQPGEILCLSCNNSTWDPYASQANQLSSLSLRQNILLYVSSMCFLDTCINLIAQIFWLTNFWRKSELELGKGWEMVTQVLSASMHYNVASTIYMVP